MKDFVIISEKGAFTPSRMVEKLDFIFFQGPKRGWDFQLEAPVGTYFWRKKAGASRLLAHGASALYFSLLGKGLHEMSL